VVVEKPEELSAGQLLKGQDQQVAKSMPKLEETCVDATKEDTAELSGSPPGPTSSD